MAPKNKSKIRKTDNSAPSPAAEKLGVGSRILFLAVLMGAVFVRIQKKRISSEFRGKFLIFLNSFIMQ